MKSNDENSTEKSRNKIFLKLLKNEPSKLKETDIRSLFHYTRDNIKEKIVKENDVVFKLSRLVDFLDKNEGIQVLEPYYHACGQLYEKQKINKEFYELLVGIKQNDLYSHITGVWLLCFSKNGYSDFLKRRYAARDGWILGINYQILDDISVSFPNEFGNIEVYEVNYSFANEYKKIKEAIKSIYQLYLQENIDVAKTKSKNQLVEILNNHSLTYKNADYRKEEEIRLVCKFKPEFSQWTDSEYGIKFVASIDGYTPEVRIILPKKHLIIEKQKLDICYCTGLNKSFMTSDGIKNEMKKYNKTRV